MRMETARRLIREHGGTLEVAFTEMKDGLFQDSKFVDDVASIIQKNGYAKFKIREYRRRTVGWQVEYAEYLTMQFLRKDGYTCDWYGDLHEDKLRFVNLLSDVKYKQRSDVELLI